MSEGLRKKIIFLTLPVALIWAGFNLSGDKPEHKQELAGSSMEPPSNNIAQTSPAISINLEEKAAQPWGTDPFRTYTYGLTSDDRPTPSTALGWTVSGIIYSSHDPIAFVNNHSVRVGDTVNEAKVMAIDKKSVIIEHNGRQITLAVNRGSG